MSYLGFSESEEAELEATRQPLQGDPNVPIWHL